MTKERRKKIKRPAAFLLAVIMVMSFNMPRGIFGIFDLVKTANAAEDTAVQPTEGAGSTENPYQIASYANLVWFQQEVDNGNYDVNAVLTADIAANNNLLNENGEVSGTPEYTWTPICRSGSGDSTSFSGVFDGRGHTISGLYAPNTKYYDYCALFGRANGTIKNLFITDSYFVNTKCNHVASFVGYGYDSCVIENCGSDAVVSGRSYCGGIAGNTYGTITNCCFVGQITAGTNLSGSIVCDYYGDGTVNNCYYTYTCGLTSTRATAQTKEQFASGYTKILYCFDLP